jgi:hypothetical protein
MIMRDIFFLWVFFLSLSSSAQTFYAKDFGAKGDGITDDGPAIRKAMEAVSLAHGERTLAFEPSRTYYIKNFKGTYLFDLTSLADITIDGGGSVFLLDGKVRFISMMSSKNMTVKDLSVDYKPLPFADGLVIAKNQDDGYIDVKISDEFDMPPLEGPTHHPDEQAYFGMLWNKGPYSFLGTHYWIADVKESFPGSNAQRMIRVKAASTFTDWDIIKPNVTRISVPVSGIAHIGPNEVVRIVESENVYLDHVNIWSAPWFAVGVTRNRGELKFKDVNICPKPRTGRFTSSWRDGFHVSANYAKLLWEDCRVEGTNDDAFNICSLASSLVKVSSDREITIKQNFPLSIVPYHAGDLIRIYDVPHGKFLDSARVVTSRGFEQTGEPYAPEITLMLDRPVQGMHTGDQVWNESSANPHTTLRHCRILNSCRFQSSVIIDGCDIKALSWFYGDNTEGPIPSNILIKNSNLFLGRGNPTSVVVFSSNMTSNGVPAPPKEPVIANIILQNNTIDGGLKIGYADKVCLLNNQFLLPRSAISLEDTRHVFLRDNSLGGAKINTLSQIRFMDEASAASAVIWADSLNDPPWLQPYNPDTRDPWNDYYGQPMNDFYWIMTRQYARLFMYKQLFRNSYLQEDQEDSIYVVKDHSIDYYGMAKPHLAPVLRVPQGFVHHFKGTVINEHLDMVGHISPGGTGDHNSGIQIYPNPAHDHITLKFDNALPGKKVVQLYDTRGQLLQWQRMDIRDNITPEEIAWNVSGLFPGLYFVKAGNRALPAAKLVKY